METRSDEKSPFDLAAVGARIRRMRQARGMSLQALATATNTSTALISQVERGLTSPSLETLWRICNAMDVTMFQFFDNKAASRVVVTRPEDRLQFLWEETPIRYTLLSPAAGRQIVMFLLRLEPGASTPIRVHTGEEGGMVLRGNLVVEVEGEKYELAEGDSIYFDSTSPHGFHNPGETIMEAVWSMTTEGLPPDLEIRRSKDHE